MSKKKRKRDGRVERGYSNALMEIDISVDIPKNMATEHRSVFVEMIKNVCQGENKLNIVDFCAIHQISRQTYYNWLLLDETKVAIDKYIEAMAVQYKPEVMDTIKQNIPNKPAYASLYLRRYEGWKGDDTPKGNITINFNVGKSDTAPDSSAIKADYKEVDS